MTKCLKCGRTLEQSDRFCGNCGAKVEQPKIEQQTSVEVGRIKNLTGVIIFTFEIRRFGSAPLQPYVKITTYDPSNSRKLPHIMWITMSEFEQFKRLIENVDTVIGQIAANPHNAGSLFSD